MTSSVSVPRPAPTTSHTQLLWTLNVSGAVRGLVLAREKGWLLARDENHWLYLLNTRGERQGQLRAPKALSVIACAEDGSALAAGGKDGEVWWLAPDLMPRWQRSLSGQVLALALDPLGQYLLASDSGGHLHLFTNQGKTLWQIQNPRPLHYVAFVPEAAFLIGCADFGLVRCVDFAGKEVWRDGLVAHVGSLTISGGGELTLACYTDGLCRYSLTTSRPTRIPLPEPCRLAAISYDGQTILAAGLSERLFVLDHKGQVKHEQPLQTPAVALALDALGTRAALGTASGCIQYLKCS